MTPDISLDQARALIERAIDKAEQLGLRGSVAVVGGSGVLVSASRMDASGAGGMARARSKAWIAATQQVPSAEHLRRMVTIAGPVAQGFVSCSPEANFPGAGGMPVLDTAVQDGAVVVGGIAASGAAVSPFYPAGTDPMDMIADGVPANPEDLVVHYALGVPYAGQHGDDEKRWRDAFGEWPSGKLEGRGMAAAPTAQAQPEHRWAVALANQVMAEAQRRGQRVAVAIADHRGDPIQQDWMPDAPTAAVAVAQAVAAAAGTFQCRSGDLATFYPDGLAGQLGALLPFPILAAPGGLPVEEDGRVVAGLGVAGRDPGACEEIAVAVLAARRAG
ncbi:MAG: heme-binding protein [Streptosporangiaceae bacterium]